MVENKVTVMQEMYNNLKEGVEVAAPYNSNTYGNSDSTYFTKLSETEVIEKQKLGKHTIANCEICRKELLEIYSEGPIGRGWATVIYLCVNCKLKEKILKYEWD